MGYAEKREGFRNELLQAQAADYPESGHRYQSLIDALGGDAPIPREAELDAYAFANGLDCAGYCGNLYAVFEELADWLTKQRVTEPLEEAVNNG